MNENVESAGPPPNPQDATVVRLWDRVFSEDLKPGAVIGHYRIIGVIGRGGMGVVFEAEQENPRRRVALKVINPGIASPELLSRFGQETQILGRLQHPGIAQIFEAGTFDLGAGAQPFFAMEFIEGRPLTDYAHAQELNTRQRLELMIRLCEAVQHAHQKGVIHRDLKPGNILVTSDGQPKILDFGVARATDGDIQSTTLRTEIGKLIGTIPYMSPEQAAGDPKELDTQSDVYALGVICYELLAGRLPYDLQQRMIHEAVRVIREDDPTPLSSVDRAFRGDIETIVAKALEKEKARRYQSASDLASDIRRYLNDEPIAARPPSTWYQLSKFTRRNRVLVSGIAAVFVALVLGLAGTSYGLKQAIEARNSEAEQKGIAKVNEQKALEQAERADREAEHAITQLNKAERIAAFMEDTLKGAGPYVALARDTAMLREMMDAAAARITSGELKDAPEAELRLRLAIGDTYRHLAAYDKATEMLDAASALAESLAPSSGESADVARALNHRGDLLADLGRAAEAEPLFQQALEMRQRLSMGDHPDVAESLSDLARMRQALGRPAEAEPLFQQALEMYQHLPKGDHPDVAVSLDNLASVRQALGRVAEAEPLLQQALEMFQRLYNGDHPYVAASLNNLASARQVLGRTAEAEPLLQQALEMNQRLFKGDHPRVAQSLNNLAFVRTAQGRAAEAEPLFQQALEMYQRLFKGDDADVARGLNNLARVRQDLGRAAEAEPLYQQALEMRQRLFKGDSPDLAVSLRSLARVRQALGRVAEAEPLLRECLAMRERLFPDGDARVWMRHDTMSILGETVASQGRFAEAEPLLLNGYSNLRDDPRVPAPTLVRGSNYKRDALERLVKLYDAWNTAEPGKGYDVKAAEWRARLLASEPPSQPATGP